MAELTPTDRLQPCLIDRLTDDRPNDTKESRDQRVMSVRQLKASVLRDLEWLLNAAAPMPTEISEEFPDLTDTVLNYGMPDLCGTTASSITTEEIERMVAEAILTFEPRLIKRSLRIRAVGSENSEQTHVIGLIIECDLWAEPLPEPLYVKTEVDLETGKCEIRDYVRG